MMDERWLPVPGYEGIYEVSNCGRVRRVKPGRGAVQGRVLKTPRNTQGYPVVGLYRDNSTVTRTVHSLVLEAFRGPRPEAHEGCHWNGIRDDNRIENLRWGTSSENNEDMIRLGRSKQASQTHCKRNHPLAEPNIYIIKGRQRSCKSCSWARSYAYRTKTEFDPTRADENYVRIVAAKHARLAERELKDAEKG